MHQQKLFHDEKPQVGWHGQAAQTGRLMKNEHALQNSIRNELAGRLPLFRINTGQAWTGDVQRLPNGDILIRNPRPFSTGTPQGFSDTFGVLTVTITPDMVGQVIGQAVFGEIKTASGRVSPHQRSFLDAMRAKGARADVWRSVEDALRTIDK